MTKYYQDDQGQDSIKSYTKEIELGDKDSTQIKLLYIKKDFRIWPSFLQASDGLHEQVYIENVFKEFASNIDGFRAIKIDDFLTQVTYEAKTVQQVLTEIAGILVLLRILSLMLSVFHEWTFNRKMSEETQEEFREVFTYENFKNNMIECK